MLFLLSKLRLIKLGTVVLCLPKIILIFSSLERFSNESKILFAGSCSFPLSTVKYPLTISAFLDFAVLK